MTDYIPFVIDLETGIHNRGEDAIGNMKASPFHPDNHIVWTGFMGGSNKPTSINTDPKHIAWNLITHTDKNGFPNIWVGHNIKFDLLYLMKDVPDFRKKVWPKIRIWDTMLAEYILSGQVKKYPALDLIAPKYGGSVKDERLKDLWDNNVDTENIDEDIIAPYLDGDLINTRLVYEGQVKRAKELGMYALILSQMKGLKATTEMEWNGMAFDKPAALEKAVTERHYIAKLESQLVREMKPYFDPHYEPNPLSPKDMRLILFGGTYEVDDVEDVVDCDGIQVRYKGGPRKGQVKTRKCKRAVEANGFRIQARAAYKTNKGNLASNEKTMQLILRNEKITSGKRDFIESVLELRQRVKDVSTYYEGYSKLVWPDGIIHHSLNHVATDTGRLSSTNPNLQNVSRKEE